MGSTYGLTSIAERFPSLAETLIFDSMLCMPWIKPQSTSSPHQVKYCTQPQASQGLYLGWILVNIYGSGKEKFLSFS